MPKRFSNASRTSAGIEAPPEMATRREESVVAAQVRIRQQADEHGGDALEDGGPAAPDWRPRGAPGRSTEGDKGHDRAAPNHTHASRMSLDRPKTVGRAGGP